MKLNIIMLRGCSSNGRALALHARGTGIDAQHLHVFFVPFVCNAVCVCYLLKHYEIECVDVRGIDVAQRVERSHSMREVPGSMPGISTFSLFFLFVMLCVC